MAHCIIAGGAESMSFIPMGVTSLLRIMLLPKAGNEDYYWEWVYVKQLHNSLGF
jgi:acetyl-CoA acyltransferase